MSSRATIDDAFSPSVLLIRLDAIGDALALTPLLEALRAASIPVDLVLRNANVDAFSSRAARTRFVAPFALRSRSSENLAAIAAFSAQIRANRYTHTLVATEDPGGYELARRVGSPVRVGFTNGWGKPLKTLWLRTMLTASVHRAAGLQRRGRHECEVVFDLGRTLLPAQAQPCRAIERLRPLVIESAVAPDDRIVFQITDKWERLGIAFEDVVRALAFAQSFGKVRAIAASSEGRYAEAIAQSAGISIDFCDDLTSWKNAIAQARALVAPDSGAIHVGGMVGTPTVAVFPPSSQFGDQAARWAPWAAPYRIVAAEAQWPERAIAGLRELLAPAHSAR